MIVVIDYGTGNVNSIANMIRKIGGTACVSSRREDIEQASQLILPGVGSFDIGVRNLQTRDLLPLLNKRVLEDGVPVLGICLGMQLMTQFSEEGTLPGLAWFPAATRRFNFGEKPARLKVPNMGWHLVKPSRSDALFLGFAELPKFYFVHSYHCVCEEPAHVLATSHHGYEFCCGIQRGNIWGVQFHPEKSHRYGLRLLGNFSNVHSRSSQAVAA